MPDRIFSTGANCECAAAHGVIHIITAGLGAARVGHHRHTTVRKITAVAARGVNARAVRSNRFVCDELPTRAETINWGRHEATRSQSIVGADARKDQSGWVGIKASLQPSSRRVGRVSIGRPVWLCQRGGTVPSFFSAAWVFFAGKPTAMIRPVSCAIVTPITIDRLPAPVFDVAGVAEKGAWKTHPQYR